VHRDLYQTAAYDEFLVDAELGATVYDGLELIAGVSNLFDNYPDKNPTAGSLGQDKSCRLGS